MSKVISIILQLTGEHLMHLAITSQTTSRDVKMQISRKMEWPCATLDLVINKQPVREWCAFIWKLSEKGEANIGVVRRTYPKPSPSTSLFCFLLKRNAADHVRAVAAHYPWKVSSTVGTRMTPLTMLFLADNNIINAMNTLLDVGVDVNYTPIADAATPLAMALNFNRPRALALLLKARADITCDFKGYFQFAVRNGYDECVKLLINAKVDPNKAK